MKTILCPIDFSETSTKALLYAYDIAMATRAGLFLLHTYHIPRVVPLMEGYQQPELDMHITYEREAFEKMDNLIYWLNKIYAPAAVKAVYKTVSNFTVDEIIKTTYEQDIDLVVLGSKHMKDLKSIFFGTNTVRVIEETHRPVFVVPASAPYAKINHLLYTSHQTQQQEMLFVDNFAKALNAEVTLIPLRERALATSRQAISENDALAENTQPMSNQVINTGQGQYIQQSIHNFIKPHPFTLLAISANRRYLLDEVNSGQASYPLLTPVLILQ